MHSSGQRIRTVDQTTDEQCPPPLPDERRRSQLPARRDTSNDHLVSIRSKVWEIDEIIQNTLMDASVPPAPERSLPAAGLPALDYLQNSDWVELAKEEYRNRRIRDGLFGDLSLFGEPAWDILLDLFIQEYECKLVSVTSASIASCAPSTTALRWLSELERKGLLFRQDDPNDCRRTFVRPTLKALDLIRSYLVRLQMSRGESGGCDRPAIPLP